MEKTKDQKLMEILLEERMAIKKQVYRLKERLKEVNIALTIVIEKRYKNEFNKKEKPD